MAFDSTLISAIWTHGIHLLLAEKTCSTMSSQNNYRDFFLCTREQAVCQFIPNLVRRSENERWIACAETVRYQKFLLRSLIDPRLITRRERRWFCCYLKSSSP